jgi:hypothetical protein
MVLWGAFGFYMGKRHSRSIRKRATAMAARDPSHTDDWWYARLKKRSHVRAKLALGVLLLGLGSYSYVSAQVMNQSVLISRVFQADLRICGPYMTTDAEKQLRAQFTQVHTKTDYREVAVKLESTAQEAKTRFVQVELW